MPDTPAPRPISTDRPRLAASIAVWRDDRVLLIERSKPPLVGVWSLPGGHVEFGETVATAALRELAEETGVEAAITALVDIIDILPRDAAGRITHHFALAAFAGTYLGGEAVAGDDAAAVRWAQLDELAGITLTTGTEAVIRRSHEIVAAAREAPRPPDANHRSVDAARQ